MSNDSKLLYYNIFSDYIYKQDMNLEYIKAPYLQKVSRNKRFEFIQNIVNKIFERTIPPHIREYMTPKINPIAFYQAVGKFSRDVYGQKRLEARMKGLEHITQINEIKQYKDYGFKVDSSSPYIHRIASVFLYWFSVIKPFSLEMTSLPQEYKKLPVIYGFFNEYITYFLIQIALAGTNVQLRIEENWDYFAEFLSDLHFRNLSRSSLEFFLASYQLIS